MNLVKFFKNRNFAKKYNKDIKKVNGVFLLELDQKAYIHYIEHTKNRENTDFETARKVLTRNVLLAQVDERYGSVYNYGNLQIGISYENKITYIRNHFGYNTNFKIDTEYKEWLNNKLGIVDDEIQDRKVS